MDNIQDFRSAVGFGMGSTKMDNELIEEAFIMGAGAATGMAAAYLDLSDEQTADFAQKVFAAVEWATGNSGD